MAALSTGAPRARAVTTVTFTTDVGFSTQPVCNDAIVATHSITVPTGTTLYACVRLGNTTIFSPGTATGVTVTGDIASFAGAGAQDIPKGAAGYFLSAPFVTTGEQLLTVTATGTGPSGYGFVGGPDRGAIHVAHPALTIQKTVSTSGLCPGEPSPQETCVTIRRGLAGGVGDARIRIDQPNTNFGADATFVTGNSPAARIGLVRFDLAAIPVGANITHASLRLTETSNTGAATVEIHRALAPWSESTVTWNSFASAFDPAAAQSFGNGGAGYVGPVDVDLTALVRAWTSGTPNDGIALLTPAAVNSTWASSEAATATARPSLQVCYLPTLGCGTGDGTTGLTGVELVTVAPSTPVKYCYAVTNTGDTTVQNISAVDDGASILVGDLAPGSTNMVSSCFSATVDVNTAAVAKGTAAVSGLPVQSAPDGAAVDVILPALKIATTVSKTGTCPGQEIVNVLPDTPLTWCYAVTNSGDTALSGVTLSDDVFGALPAPGFPLARGETVILSRADVSANDTTLTAHATGTSDLSGGSVRSNDDPAAVNVVGPRVDIDVTVSTDGHCPGADTATVPAGTSVTYCYLVKNIGDDTLTQIDVFNQDNSFSGFVATLPPGGSQMLVGAPVTVASADALETGFATAIDEYGYFVDANDLAKVHSLYPGLTVKKTVSTTGQCPGGELATVVSGTAVTYCYEVENTGLVSLTSVVVNDVGAPVTVGDLAPGAVTVVSVPFTATADASTPAVATGTNALTHAPFSSAPDGAAVDVIFPTLSIQKTVALGGLCPGAEIITVLSGTEVSYCYEVTNTGDAAIDGIFVGDDGASVQVGTLAPGASTTVQASLSVNADTNTPAVATGTASATGTPVASAPDAAAVDVVRTGLTIQKTVSTTGSCPGVESVSVLSGAHLAYCYEVTNTGDVGVAGVTVTDDDGAVVSLPDLAPGATATGLWPFDASGPESTHAVAAGTALAVDAPVVSNRDGASVLVVSPSLSVAKTVSLDGTCPGAELVTVAGPTAVTYCYAVTNTGDTAVGGVTVSDGGVSVTIGDLAPGESGAGTASLVVAADANTPATAGGTVTATGTSVSSPPDAAAVDVVAPALSIAKTVSSSGTCPGAELITVLANSGVTYCYAVTNTGDTAIGGVVVADDGALVTIGDLAPGQTGSGAGVVVVSADTSTAATATGTTTATGTPVSSGPDAAAVDVVSPGLVIQKTVSLSGACPGDESVTVLPNTGVTYCYAVTNTGDTAVGSVVVNDVGGPLVVGDLAPGQTGSASAPYLALAAADTFASASGTTTVTGTPITSGPDDAAVHVVTPKLAISTTVSTTGACPGQEVVNVRTGTAVTWCYAVTNAGDTSVDGITVTDSAYGLVPGAAFSLAPGQSQTLSLAVSANNDLTLSASAAGTEPITGTPVQSPQDPAVVNVVNPVVDVDVTVSVSGACPGVDAATVPAGTTVAYCYKVTNNGDETLTTVDVTDGQGGSLGSLSDLGAGQSVTISSPLTVVQGDATVSATAAGTDAYGFQTSDSDTALVHALFAKLAVQKTVSLDGACPGVESVTVLAGTPATYCYLVTNTGDTPVTDILVDDAGAAVAVGNLAPGQSAVVSRAVAATVDEATSATADGVNPATGKPVESAPDDAAIDVVAPKLVIEKTASLDGTCPGVERVTVLANTAATYCYVVTNAGDTTIGDVTVTDLGISVPVGTLASGQAATVSAAVTAGNDDLDSFAVAAGNDTASWTKVTSTPDDALVDVIHPALAISTTVSTTGACPGQDVVNVLSGTSVTWCYTVTNTGDVAVEGITATDDQVGAVPGAAVSLAPGASFTFSRAVVESADVTATAVASGADALLSTRVVSNDDPAVVNVVSPAIDVDVTASASGVCPGLDAITVEAGATAAYCYKVTNQGDDTLVDVVVRDAAGNVITTIPALDAGQSVLYAAAPVVELADATATGTASAVDQYGFPVSDTDTALVHVLYPNLRIVKTAPSQVAGTGSAALTYGLTVVNLGQATAVHPVVTDVLPAGETYVGASSSSGACTFSAGTLSCALADLAPGASATISVDVTVTARTGAITNVASVGSSSPDSDPSDNTSSATTQITGGGATRTIGFYANHPKFTQACLTTLGGAMDIGWLTMRDEKFDNEIDAAAVGNGPDKDTRKETGIAMVMGILNANVDHYTNDAKRPALEQSKMQAAKQLVAAICNWRYVGTAPSFDIAGMIQAMKGSDAALILSYAAQADAFNNSGDALSTTMSPGPANSKYPWDDPTDPND